MQHGRRFDTITDDQARGAYAKAVEALVDDFTEGKLILIGDE